MCTIPRQSRLPGVVTLIVGMLLCYAPTTSKAHKIKQTRIIHLLVKGQQVELYINFLLPRSPKARFWITLFDRNRDRRLSPNERRALGAHLARRVTRSINLFVGKQQIRLKQTELQNSKLRGNPRKRSYSWDYRLSGRLQTAIDNTQSIKLRLKRLFPSEIIPVALVALGAYKLKRTRTSYVLRRNGTDRAVCQLSPPNATCLFTISPKATPTSQPSTSPTRSPSH